jgi:hypothetical protein
MEYFGDSIQNTVDAGACSDGGIAGLLGQPAGALINVSSNAGTQIGFNFDLIFRMQKYCGSEFWRGGGVGSRVSPLPFYRGTQPRPGQL